MLPQPYFTEGSRITTTLYQCDARRIPLPDQSVHCVVTSPPYYGLRVYRTGEGAIGLEQTPEQYLDAMMEVFDEVWRVLRDDGVCWVNLGDSYGGTSNGGFRVGERPGDGGPQRGGNRNGVPSDMAAGQLLQIPARFTLRMQERGWILRDDVIWAKKSAMPESLAGTRWERHRRRWCLTCLEFTSFFTGRCIVCEGQESEWRNCPGCPKCEDNGGLVLRRGSWRCTSSYEHIFMFVKRMGYWSDGEAVKVAAITDHMPGRNQTDTRLTYGTQSGGNMGLQDLRRKYNSEGLPSTANRRNVWRDIKPEPYGGEHYATFPRDLPKLCIQASTSEKGACSQCGSQWARVVDHKNMEIRRTNWGDSAGVRTASSGTMESPAETQTLGWRPTCTCDVDIVPPLVLDPFCGTGTTCLAAQRLGVSSVGVDLSEDYLEQAKQRLAQGVLL